MGAQAVLLFVAALLGGAINSVAGGGSFLTFPALILSGVPPIHANATSTVALWPGSVASVGAYRRELRTIEHALLFSLVSLVGGALGAIVLLRTPSATFQQLIPYLLLAATLLLGFGPKLNARLRRNQTPDAAPGRLNLVGSVLLQLVIATYGGFFGGGIGILMLALFGLLGLDNIHVMNALKTLLASCINGIAVLIFVVERAVSWPQASLMLVAAIIGGYGGASVARKLDPLLVRRLVLAIGCAMTIYFFVRG